MANTTLPLLTAGVAVQAGDLFISRQGIDTVDTKVTATQIKTFMTAGVSSAFDAITSGTNTTAAMAVGSGATLTYSGTGTITATHAAIANEATDTTCFISFVTTATGDQALKSNAGLTFNSNTGILAATGFSGPLTGNVTGNVSGSSGSTTGNAATATALQNARLIGNVSFDGTANITPTQIQPAAENSDTTNFPLFVNAASGTAQQPKYNSGFGYNSSTNALTATTFIGALTGNADTAIALQTARNIGGVSFNGTADIVPQTIQSNNEATDTTCFPLFITASGTQSLQPKNNILLTFNSNTGALGASALVLSGNASPSYIAGSLYYDTGNESLTFYNNDSNIGLQVGQEEWIRVTNNTGSTIANGSAVYLNGASGGMPTIALAQSNAGSTTIGAGLATESIANGAIGYVTCIGVVHGLDTSAFTAGATVYISSTVAGGLVSTAPTSPNYRYRIGIVGTVSATVGTIHVTPSTAALGNGAANQVAGINTAGTAQEYKTIAAGTGITVTPTAGTITIAATGGGGGASTGLAMVMGLYITYA